MDFESLKEQLLEKLRFYKSQIEDSSFYIQAKERYDTLTPKVQQAVKYGTIIFVIYIFYSIPASFVNSANEKLTFFEENRQLTRELIRAGRISKTIKLPQAAPSSTQLTSQVDGILNQEQVLPEQKIATTSVANVASKKLVPKSIKQEGIKTSVKKVNLRQLIRIGESLNNINSSQLMNIAIQADAKDPHYYSVDYEVAAFSVPQTLAAESKDGKKKKKSRFKSKFKKKGSK